MGCIILVDYELEGVMETLAGRLDLFEILSTFNWAGLNLGQC